MGDAGIGHNGGPPIEVVWKPIPESSQEIALDSRCDATLYWGSRGPGKTETQLMRFYKRVGMGYGKFWRGVIFDHEYKSLEDVVSKSQRIFKKFGDGARFLSSKSDYKWVWPTGEELLFRAASTEKDYDKYHGQEFPFIGWNELTKYPNGKLYHKMLSVNRTSFTPEKDSPRNKKGEITKLLPPLRPEVFSTTNPAGVGHGWVKRKFIDPAPVGTIIRTTEEITNPLTQEVYEETISQIAIKGMWFENPYLPKNYVMKLKEDAEPHLVEAWLNASWDIVAGGAVDDVWNAAVHVIPRFAVPHTWLVDRVFDWGSSEPFHVGWWAEANGEAAKVYFADGTVREFCPRPGSLILINEWYGTTSIGSNKGLKLSATSIARGILERERHMLEQGWCKDMIFAGPADNQISNVREVDVDTIETKMSKEGVYFTSSIKSPGSNANGLELFRDRLEASIKHEGPGIYFMDNCRASIAIIPSLPRDEKKPEEVDHNAEDHPWDTCKYRVLKGSEKRVTSLDIRTSH